MFNALQHHPGAIVPNAANRLCRAEAVSRNRQAVDIYRQVSPVVIDLVTRQVGCEVCHGFEGEQGAVRKVVAEGEGAHANLHLDLFRGGVNVRAHHALRLMRAKRARRLRLAEISVRSTAVAQRTAAHGTNLDVAMVTSCIVRRSRHR